MTHNRCIIKQIIRQFSLILASMEKKTLSIAFIFSRGSDLVFWYHYIFAILTLNLCRQNDRTPF